MIGALWTGISGLSSQQQALDNESNNIANVNTIGFKSSRVSFADQMYQNQIGKGSQITDVEKIYSQGNLKTTGFNYDLALTGDGFFTVKNPESTGERLYTRAGNFRMGDSGNLTDSNGYEIQGWAMSPLDPNKDIVSSNSNIKKFTEEVNKKILTQVVKTESEVFTYNVKSTDYTNSSISDSEKIFSGAGFNSKYNKISDIEALTEKYASAMASYASEPTQLSSAGVTQHSYVDYDLDSNVLTTGDQLFIYINGTKYTQNFETDQQTTIKKFADRISEIPGINSYIGDSVTATKATPNDPNGYLIIESIIPGEKFTISQSGITQGVNDTLTTFDTNVQAIEGSGETGLISIRNALEKAVAGNTRHIWSDSDLPTIDSVGGADNFDFKMLINNETYTISLTEGSNVVTTDSSDTTPFTTSANLDNTNKINMIIEAINSHSKMSEHVEAKNVNGFLVIESKDVGVDFNSTILHTDGGTSTTTAIEKNLDYSINSGAGAEFLQIKTSINQNSSLDSLQLRLDTLGISDNAFGDFSVDESGLISMEQEGLTVVVGQLAIANFSNNRGLSPVGDNMVLATLDSGNPKYSINNNGTATINDGTLELSTADLSESLVNLMVWQRAFEANAKSITTSDTILNTLINLKR